MAPSPTLPSAGGLEHLPEYTGSIPHRRHVAAQPRIETETAAGSVERKQEHDHRQEDVGPRPLRRVTRLINAKPKVQHENDRKAAGEAHTDHENERHGECELGQENDGAEDIEMGQIDIGHQLAVEGE